MSARTRSIVGVFTMLAILPILAGLLACMPVPIGDPERSRIDPDINGVWAGNEEFDFGLYSFQPYDKRTWLVMGTVIEPGANFEGEFPDIETTEDMLRLLANAEIGDTGITSLDTVAYKAWLTKIGGVRFMTWEQVGGFDDEGNFTPEYWYVFKINKVDANQFELYMVNAEHDAFDDLVKPKDYEGEDYVKDMRRKWERALRKVAKDETLYGDGEPPILTRVTGESLEGASELFQEVISWDE